MSRCFTIGGMTPYVGRSYEYIQPLQLLNGSILFQIQQISATLTGKPTKSP